MSNPTIGSTAADHLHLASFNHSVAPTCQQNDTTIVSGRTFSVRETAGDFDDCLDCVKSTLQSIGNFFTHRYADFRMFVRAVTSMGVSSYEINRRVNAVYQLRTQVMNSGYYQRNLNAIHDRFTHLDATVQNLFFYVDVDYTRELAFGPDRSQVRQIREEIIRECDQVISYQRSLTAVNAFFNMFFQNSEAPATTIGDGGTHGDSHGGTTFAPDDAPDFQWDDWFNQLIRDRFGIGHEPRHRASAATTVHGATTARGHTLGSVDLNIPGTVQYLQNEPPANLTQRLRNGASPTEVNDRSAAIAAHLFNALTPEVQAKAQLISNLKTQFDNLPHPQPNIPDLYQCPVTSEIMTVPVFDASHPDVQNALRAANVTGATSSALNNRNIRHAVEYVSLEEHLITKRNAGDPRQCINCRHPNNRNHIERRNLLIDTALQDQILQFLRTAVNPGATTH